MTSALTNIVTFGRKQSQRGRDSALVAATVIAAITAEVETGQKL